MSKFLGFGKNGINLSIGEQIKKNNNFFSKLSVNFDLYQNYPKTNFNKKLLKNFKKTTKKKYGVELKNKNIIPSLGNRDGLYTSFLIFNKIEKKYVILFKPYYPIYKNICDFFNKKIILIKKNIRKKFIKYNKLINFIIICSPNNPDGNIINKKQINKIILYCNFYNIKIISDECYSDIYFKKLPTSIIKFKKKTKNYSNVIILNSLSKRSCAPGLRSGFYISSKKNINSIKVIKNISGTLLSEFNQYISAQLWKDNKHVKKIRNKYKERIKKCVEILKKNKIKIKKPKGGFYLWINIKKYAKNDIIFCKKLYKNNSIKILPGEIFGVKNYIRIALVVSKKKCIYSIKKIIKCLKNEKKNK